MAHHRSGGGNGIRQRGVSRGLIFGLLSVILIAGVVVVWMQLGDHLDREADDAAANCVEGEYTVHVAADPDLAPGLMAVAQNYAETSPVVRDHCVSVEVRPSDARVMLDALRADTEDGDWNAEAMGQRPAAWIPQSSVWSAELMTSAPAAVQGKATSLVSSPVVLATSPELAEAFDGGLDWAQLPTLQGNAESLADVGLDGWGALRMAMPLGAQADASALASQAVAAQIGRSALLTEADATSPQVQSSLRALIGDAPTEPAGMPSEAATAIADAQDPAQAPIHATPITEQQLYQLTKNDAETRLAQVLPTGPTPIADYPVIRLASPELSDVDDQAIVEFIRFAAEPDQLSVLTGMGFRGAAPLPAPTPTVTFPVTPDPMPRPEDGAILAINGVLFPRP